MKTDDVLRILRNRHPVPEWVFFDELRCGVGYQQDSEKRVDAWAIHCYQRPIQKGDPKGNHIVAYEVKVSRTDWLREFKPRLKWGEDEAEPKRAAALRLSNYFYFVVPHQMVAGSEVPDDSGLMYVKPNGSIEVVKPAPFREIESLTPSFVASLARRVYMAQNGHNGRNIHVQAQQRMTL